MSLLRSSYRIIASAVVATVLFAAPAWAQGTMQDNQLPASGDVAEAGMVAPYKWNISFGVGSASGANPVGSFVDEDVETIFTYDVDDGILFSGRAAYRFWWRLGGELEFGYADPGVTQTTTNLQGASVTTEPFGDYSFGYLAISARLDLIDARITPFLLGGFATTFNSYPDGSSGTEPGFLFGGGVDVQVVDNIYVRGDLRGLRANIDAASLSRGILEQFEEDRAALVTELLWTVGVAVRF